MESDKRFFMLRVKEVDYINVENLNCLISHLKKFKDSVNSVALFVSNLHNYITLSEIEKRVTPLEIAIKKIKEELEISAGINLLSTIGHLEEDTEKKIDLPVMVDYTGKKARNIPCPASDEFLKETEIKYKLLAQTSPDFIWIDDDLRPHNHGPLKGIGCFCDNCIEKFNIFFGENIKRGDIEKFIQEDSYESREFFKKWNRWCDEILIKIAEVVENSVHSVNPNIKLGLMLCGGFYPSFRKITEKLRKENKWIFIRPGGGFYTDEYPKGFIFKSIEYSRQIFVVSPKKDDKILAEIENFPCNYQKSAKILYLEILSSIAGGCNGVTLNITGMVPDSLKEYDFIFTSLKNKRKILEKIIEEVKNIPLCGIYYSGETNYSKFRKINNEFPSSPENLIFAGIPITKEEKGKIIRAETFSSIYGKEKEEIERIFSENIITEAPVLLELERFSLINLAGVKLKERVEGFILEKFLPHKINAPYENAFRDSRPGFFKFPSFILKPVDEEVIPLNELKRDFSEGKRDGYSTIIYKNGKGGKIVVFGYDPWCNIFTAPKLNQLRNLLLYLSDYNFPFFVLSPPRLSPFLRCNEDKFIVFLFNCNFDTITDFEFFSSFNFEKIECFEENGEWKNIEFHSTGDRKYKIYREIKGWDVVILRFLK